MAFVVIVRVTRVAALKIDPHTLNESCSYCLFPRPPDSLRFNGGICITGPYLYYPPTCFYYPVVLKNIF